MMQVVLAKYTAMQAIVVIDKKIKMQLNKITDNIFSIDNFWILDKCEKYILESENIGYEPAKIDTEKGQKVILEIRNNNRIIFKDETLALSIWIDLKDFAPQQIGNSFAVGINELFRFYKYQSGQQFKKHKDQSFIRNEIEASYYTFMIYLNENYEGGETTFTNAVIKPKAGMALIFLHDLG